MKLMIFLSSSRKNTLAWRLVPTKNPKCEKWGMLTMGLWDSKEQRLQLLCELVEIPSVTGSQAEYDFPYQVVERFNKLQYFQEFPSHLQLHPTGDGRHVVTALVKRTEDATDTVVLLSHYDVVDVQDYGSLREESFRPNELTALLHRDSHLLPKDAFSDVRNGNWLFGRGTMDMKCGLALHMSILEQACNQMFDGNILLVTVPDEEVNSAGMHSAVSVLTELARTHNLNYQLMLNSEPVFPRYPGDRTNYVYTGSIGKVLPGFLCYGQEAHVGEPWSGLNGNYMVSMLTNELELSMDLCEEIDGELTPPPTNLIQKGLKDDYSAQIPHRAVTLFNMFVYRRQMQDVVNLLVNTAQRAASKIEAAHKAKARAFSEFYHTDSANITVSVMTYAELHAYAVSTYGEQIVRETLEQALRNYDIRDHRDAAVHKVNQLATLCRERGPMIVLFFAPPYYPAVSSVSHPLIPSVVETIIHKAEHDFGITLQHQKYFGGISDLSFVGLEHPVETMVSYIDNNPLWPESYALPLEAMAQLTVPVFNLGPIGRDAHKWIERLDVDYAFTTLYELLELCIRTIFLQVAISDGDA